MAAFAGWPVTSGTYGSFCQIVLLDQRIVPGATRVPRNHALTSGKITMIVWSSETRPYAGGRF